MEPPQEFDPITCDRSDPTPRPMILVVRRETVSGDKSGADDVCAIYHDDARAAVLGSTAIERRCFRLVRRVLTNAEAAACFAVEQVGGLPVVRNGVTRERAGKIESTGRWLLADDLGAAGGGGRR